MGDIEEIEAAVAEAVTGTAPEPADAVAIERLIAAYAQACDFALVDEVVSLFTADAVWDGREFRFPRCEGTEELRAHFDAVCGKARQVHIMDLPILRAGDSPDTATGIVPFSAMEADGDSIFAAQHAFGLYQDRYRRGDDGWRIEQRILRLRLVRR